MLAEYEQWLLSQDHYIIILQIDVVVKLDLSCLLADIGDPGGLYLSFFIIAILLYLQLLLLLQVVVCKCFHWVEVVALNFKVAVSDNKTVGRLGENHRPGHQEVRELYFEQHVVIIEEVERAINRLDANLVILGTFVSELAAHEVVRVPLEPVDLTLGDFWEFVSGFNDMQGEEARGQDGEAEALTILSESPVTNL